MSSSPHRSGRLVIRLALLAGLIPFVAPSGYAQAQSMDKMPGMGKSESTLR